MTPAARYIRVSSDHQRNSLPAQVAQIEAYAAGHAYEIVRSYEDHGRSGLRIAGRTGLQSLLADVLAGTPGYRAILVQDVSRWGRFQDTDEAAHYEFVCRAAGVEVRYCAEPFDALPPRTGDIVKAVKRLMAADFSRELSGKVRHAQFHHAAAGYKMGGVAGYGLRRAVISPDGTIKAVLELGQQRLLREDRIVLVPGPPQEVALVRRIFAMFLQDRLGLAAIAARLNAEGLAGEGGRPWNPWTIGNLLANPKYAGVYRFGRRRRTLDGRRKDAPAEDLLTVEGVVEALVPLAWITTAAKRRRKRMLFLPRVEIWAHLKRHAASQGALTVRGVAADPELPSPRTCCAHFGPWRRILARLDLQPPFLPGQIDRRTPLGDWAGQTPAEVTMSKRYTVFVGADRLADGDLATVVRAVHAAQDRRREMPIVFDDSSGQVVDLDLRGDAEDAVRRLDVEDAPGPAGDTPRGRGRPKLGVTAREVTLLPRHWAWLQEQPGGASAALRRLIEQAQQDPSGADARRAAQTAAYKVMYALAGHLAGYEEALRALYAGDADRFTTLVSAWPDDVSAYVRRLAAPGFTV